VEKKHILVTGGAGLVGSNLCRRLVADGHAVISLDNYFAGTRDNHVDGVEYREGHTKDIGRLVPETPDIIFHLGEYARVEQSLLEPELVHDLNTVGTAAVVEYWKERRCKLIYAGSSTKFGDGGAAREKTPYASTKAANTELVKQVGDAEGLPYAITYFYNVYGPGERAGIYGTVIEAFKQMYLKGEPLTVTAPGTQLRNFTHVDDIVDGLVLVAEKGQGDEYGLGNETSLSILDVAKLFLAGQAGSDILMLPPRAGNRMQSGLDLTKSRSIGWHPQRSLEAYIHEFTSTHPRGKAHDKRVLVFSTTFYPTQGPAEEALLALIKSLPSLQFDVVTTRFAPGVRPVETPLANVHVHRVGRGSTLDKYLLPFDGSDVGAELSKHNRYLFAWSLMASYAGLAGIFFKRKSGLPLLITLADQRLDRLSLFSRMVLRYIFRRADQVYAIGAKEEAEARSQGGELRSSSIGEGDAFANQLRYSYAELLLANR
jgi:UDP-glucose 4-epimerase